MNSGTFSSKIGMIVFVGALALLQMGTIRRKEDPILKTQTDPILYKQKMDEIKDGEKGAPSPSFRHYDKAGFLAELPVENPPKAGHNPAPAIPQVGDPIPENLSEEKTELPASVPAPALKEEVPVPQADIADQAADEVGEEVGMEDASSDDGSKNDDDWWYDEEEEGSSAPADENSAAAAGVKDSY